MLTYKSLYSLVNDQIKKGVHYNTTAPYTSDSQSSRTGVEPFMMPGSGRRDLTANELIESMQGVLDEALPNNIIEGLEVTAMDPISSLIQISAGKGTAGGVIYTLSTDTTLTVPFDGKTELFYVTIYNDTIRFDKQYDSKKLKLAKIVVPNPERTVYVQDTKDASWNAYIQSFKEYKLYGFNDKFEEDTIELLRDNIGVILADNLIGNIRLSENLKITNTAGTLELDSNKVLIKDLNSNILTKLDYQGVYFYNSDSTELAKFTATGAHIGNILITPNTLQTRNYVALTSGFQITDTGDAEFNQLTVRGTVHATSGSIGGWTIDTNELYATTTGTIKTGPNVSIGQNGVVLDRDGIRMYDAILGIVANFPSDGTRPTISAGTIGGVNFEINTNTVIRTSLTVGDGSIDSYGILINNTGIYGCQANQLLSDANFKVLANGDAYFRGTISATAGQIGSVVITPTSLVGGLIQSAEIISPIIESSATLPRIRMDTNGIYYQVTSTVGQYNTFQYNDGTKYGTGVLAYLFNTSYPVLSIVALSDMADIRLFSRVSDPAAGTHAIGDLIMTGGILKLCTVAATPGTFKPILSSSTTTGGTGSAGAGKQYIEINVNGTVYKVLHDGVV